MTYDIVRWAFGLILFIVMMIIMIKITKNKGKSIVSAACTALVISGVLLLIPVENYFYSFCSVEKAYNYKHHEALISYVECDEGVLCIGQKTDGSFICYTLEKSEKGYKLPQGLNEKIRNHSSKFGIFIFKQFDNQSLILTQVRGSKYDGKDFVDNGDGYYYFIVDGKIINSCIGVGSEKVTLV